MPKNTLTFQEKLALYSAPTLIGMKTASLFRIQKKDIPDYKECLYYYNQHFNEYGIQICILHENKTSVLIYIYEHTSLNHILSNPLVWNILKQFDYPNQDLTKALNHLRRRLLENEFPHEIGFFLGYPLHDVISFMDKSSKCKLIGHWKVYGNVKNTQKTFQKFECCTKMVHKKISNGESIFQLVERSLDKAPS